MKKGSILTIGVVLILVCFYFGYMYYNGPKIIDGVVSESRDDNGKPIGITTEFSPEDTVYFSAEGNRFWIKKAQVVWYKGEVRTENRILVEDDIVISKEGYFSTKLSLTEDLEEGQYSVSIYVAGKDIIETHTRFVVKDNQKSKMEESNE